MSAITMDFYTEGLLDARASWTPGQHANQQNLPRLESLINRGIGIFIALRNADEIWSKKVQAGRAKFDPRRVRFFHKEYKRWLEPCENVLSLIEKTERKVALENADMFRSCWRSAQRLAGIDVESLIKSVAQAQNGEGIPLNNEFWAELYGHDHTDREAASGGSAACRGARTRKAAG